MTFEYPEDVPAAWRDHTKRLEGERDNARFDGFLLGIFVGLMLATACLVLGINLI